MRKTGLTLAALGALAVLLSACSSNPASSAGSAYGGSTATTAANATASSGSEAMTSQPKSAMLTIKKTKIGYVLANARGYTLYWYSRDVKNGGSSACTGQCLSSVACPHRQACRRLRDQAERDPRNDHEARRRPAGHLQRLPAVHLHR